ncbi:MAG: glycosyltransferase family 4 protein [Rhodocyclaceae bacterium]|nr:glycosyltransferase family 4 protein [Rhodocyclaceae bacterium]
MKPMDTLSRSIDSAAGLKVFYDPRWLGQHGIGRFAAEVTARLPEAEPLQIHGRRLAPWDPVMLSLALAGKTSGIYFSPGFNPPLRSPIPFAFTVHDLIHLHVPEESSAIRRLYYRSIVLPAARRAHTVFTVSEFTKARILEWSGIPADRVIVVGNGTSAAFSPDGPRHSLGRPYFLHVGRRVAHKNIPRLLQAFRNSRASQEANLLFTGDEDESTAKCIDRLGMRASIHFTGTLSDSALAAVYRGAEALLFPSLYEGFGLPIIEAMACGTPVLTSNVAAMPEVTGTHGAVLVAPINTDEIANGIDRIAYDECLRNRLIANGLARRADFTWEQTARSILARFTPHLNGNSRQ